MYKVYGLSRNGKGFWSLRRKNETLLRFDSSSNDLIDALERSSNHLLKERRQVTKLVIITKDEEFKIIIYTFNLEEI